jgi:hypothetical protein
MNKKTVRCIATIGCISALISNSIPVYAAPKTMADGSVFDADYYAENNPDVVSVLGTDENALYQHYVTYGQAEGRLPYSPNADVSLPLRDTDSTNAELKAAVPGTYITFGAYEQDNNKKNGQEPIEWLVIENNGKQLLVLSRYCLDGQPYSTSYDTYTYNAYPVTWETCSLRAWLNSTFYTTAFNQAEQMRIATTLLNNSETPTCPEGSSGLITVAATPCNDTYDKVFLLSYADIIKYFSSNVNQAGLSCDLAVALTIATPYAVANGAHNLTNKDVNTAKAMGGDYETIAANVGNCSYWSLRTVATQTIDFNVNFNGAIGFRPVAYDTSDRMAMWINLE